MLQNKINKNLHDLEQSATLAVNEHVSKLRASGQDIYNMGLGQSPFPVPEHVVEALRKNAQEKDYISSRGLSELRHVIAEYQARKTGFSINKDGVIIGPGSKELLFILQLVFEGEILVPTPSWVSYVPQARIAGKTVRFLHTKSKDRWLLKPEHIKSAYANKENENIPRVLILNYPGNPTGTTYSEDELKAIADASREHGLIIVSDEIYGELSFNKEHISIAKYYPEGTIVSTGISKWCGAGGWRLGAFIFPEELDWLLNAMETVASETFTSVSAPIQYAAVEAFKENNKMKNYLFNARRVLSCLTKEGVGILRSAGINVHEPDGAFYIFADFSPCSGVLKKRGVGGSKQIAERLLEDASVAVLPGSAFNRPDDELLARISLVDFQGGKALESAMNIPFNQELPKDFCYTNCTPAIKGLESIAKWVR